MNSWPMHRIRSPFCLAGVVALVAILYSSLACAAWFDLGGEAVTVRLLEDDGSRSVIEITIGGFEAEPVDIDGGEYILISLPGEGLQKEVGLPQLPSIRRSLIIPDDREMGVTVLASEHVDLPNIPVAPSKGYLLRTVDPAMVAYTFDDLYASGGAYPVQQAELGTPYILRDHRGQVVDAHSFQYDASTQTLRVYTRLVLEVAPVGPGLVNVLDRISAPKQIDRQFAQLYGDQFLNYGPDKRYDLVYEDGSLLIISYEAYAGFMAPLVEWKNQKGLSTRLVTLADTGPSYSQIHDYILQEYQTTDLAYVLLVGDGQHVPKYGSDSDPGYSLLAGSDSYPEIFVGRFSAESPEDVQTQVQRTITYERDTVFGNASRWLQSGMGVASNQGPGHFGEYDDDHMDFIRDDLLGYGYTEVDQIYDPYGTSSMVTTALNTGRGAINYCGHGSQTSWGSTGFNNSNVNALVNDNMLPFIISVACNNGTFTSGTCFAEAWQRATHNGVPTGAVASYMSYVSQSWDPPMYAQDEAVDLMVGDVLRTVGGLWFNGSCEMMDMAGSTGMHEFRNWTLFGDPSLTVRTKQAQEMVLSHTGVLLIGLNEYVVDVPGVEGALCALYADGVLYGKAATDAMGHAVITMAEPPLNPLTLTLTVTAYNMVTQVADIPVLPPEGPYLVFEAAAVDDQTGDADGELDNGEVAGLTVTLENVGVEDATNVTAVLTTDDPFIAVNGGSLTFPDILAGSTGTCDSPCPVQVAGDVPDAHVVQFNLHITADSGIWDTSFFATVQAPLLNVQQIVVDDSMYGDDDGYADAGERVALTIQVINVGHSATDDLDGILTTMDPNVIILSQSAQADAVPPGEVQNMGSFEVQILAACPEPSFLEFQLAILDRVGYATDLDLEITVGGWYDDMEVDRGWITGAPDDNASSGTWVRLDPIGTLYEGHVIQSEDDHTADPASICFVTGNGSAGGTAGENDVDGGKTTLMTPVFDLAGAVSASVSYWRWYTNSWGNNPDQDWWDVEVTNDGVQWVSLEHTMQTETAWVQQTFELTDYIVLTDHVQIRFIASDESPGSLVEAAVDDFLLSIVRPTSTPVEEDRTSLPVRLALGENFPNPFNPKTTIKFELPRSGPVEVAVYDITGRKVVTLLNEELEAGHHELSWLGKDQGGQRVASGIYFYRLLTDEETLTRKMTIVK